MKIYACSIEIFKNSKEMRIIPLKHVPLATKQLFDVNDLLDYEVSNIPELYLDESDTEIIDRDIFFGVSLPVYVVNQNWFRRIGNNMAILRYKEKMANTFCIRLKKNNEQTFCRLPDDAFPPSSFVIANLQQNIDLFQNMNNASNTILDNLYNLHMFRIRMNEQFSKALQQCARRIYMTSFDMNCTHIEFGYLTKHLGIQQSDVKTCNSKFRPQIGEVRYASNYGINKVQIFDVYNGSRCELSFKISSPKRLKRFLGMKLLIN